MFWKTKSPYIKAGKLTIPQGIRAIKKREYEMNPSLVQAEIPGTVETIGYRAFADCPNLRKVILHEGIKTIEDNVFIGCGALESIVLPCSVENIQGWAFYGSELKEPVFSASGDRLIYCPKEAAGRAYKVPEGVREIGVQAFINQEGLKEVILPEGLTVIRNRAFIGCGFTEIVIPDSVRTVETGAFFCCRELQEIKIKGETDVVKARLEALRMENKAFLVPYRIKLPEERYWETSEFQALARQCSLGETEAMQKMADYFEEKAAEPVHQTGFYEGAFHFWTYRAYEGGSRKAKEYLEAIFRAHPEKCVTFSSYLTENLQGLAEGEALRAMGFFFFREGLQYELKGKDGDGVVEVKTWVDDDGPDEDGFGREEYYDFWYLDDRLNLPPGGECVHNQSESSKGYDGIGELFRREHDIAARAVKEHGRK